MSLSGELGDLPSLNDSCSSITFGDSADVNVFVVFKDLSNSDFLLELRLSPVDLLGNVSSVDLNLNNMSFLLSEVEEMDLSVSNNSDDSGVLLDSVKISGN